MPETSTSQETNSASTSTRTDAQQTHPAKEEAFCANAKAGKTKQFAVITTIIILFACTIVTVFILPPSGTQQVSQTAESAFVLKRATRLLTPGVSPEQLLRYSAIQQQQSFQLVIQEENTYPQGNKVTSEFHATVNVTSTNSENPGAVFVSLSNVDVTIHDGETQKEAPTIGNMIEGVILEGRIHPEMGLGKLIPLAKINPQAGRVLYIVTDILRIAWTPLAHEAVGFGGMWNTIDKTNEAQDEQISITTTLKPAMLAIETTRKIKDQEVGTGKAQLYFNNTSGHINELKGNLNSQFTETDRQTAKHSVVFSLNRIE